MEMNAHIHALKNVLDSSEVVIQPHNYPDPDALASAYALQYLLKQFGVRARLCHIGAIERAALEYIVQYFGIQLECLADTSEKTSDGQIILVDGQKFNANMTDLPGDEVACIDHHPTAGARDCGYRKVFSPDKQ